MIYIEAPELIPKKLFLAGGITSCQDWQKVIYDNLQNENVIILNPRRKEFDIANTENSKIQIEWENEAMKQADLISFWFPKESICPITLFEFGKWTSLHKEILVGMDPEYPRRQDVEIQGNIMRTGIFKIDFVYSLENLITKIKENL